MDGGCPSRSLIPPPHISRRLLISRNRVHDLIQQWDSERSLGHFVHCNEPPDHKIITGQTKPWANLENCPAEPLLAS